jgi:GABA permease
MTEAGKRQDARVREERPSDGLRKDLKRRHLTMISLGGVIGAGLFVGSGAIISAAGPAAVVTYALAGALVLLIMRMLGEMATAEPSVGSFSEYSRISLGGWAGFSIGWLYWYFLVIVVGFEAVAGAQILNGWFPAVPSWAISLALVVLLTATNLWSVRSFGEFEYWFASIKVAAIVVFIVLGTLFVLGLWPGDTPGFSNLAGAGDFAPNGVLAVFAGIVTVIFSFVGIEMVTIAAAESEEPEEGVERAINTVLWRILVFYVASVFLVAAIVRWDDEGLLASPFASALGVMGIPAAPTVMNLVVLTAVLSVLNSCLYASSRMLFALTERGYAPRALAGTNRRGVPVKAILAGTAFGWVAVVMNYLSPETVFVFLINSSGAVALLVYLMIALSELRMRRRLEREAPERLRVRMWGYPYLTLLSIACILAVLTSMALVPDTRPQLLFTLFSLAVVIAAYAAQSVLRGRTRSPKAAETAISRPGRGRAR